MLIGEFSKKTGLSIDTIRYYEKIGLLKPEKIVKKRHYHQADLELVENIIKLKNISFSLEDIRAIIGFDSMFDDLDIKSEAAESVVLSLKALLIHKYEYISQLQKDIAASKKSIKNMLNKLDNLKKYKP